VNSIHRQGIKTLAPGLIATVKTEDGLVEGYESAERNIIAVQWHPEEMTSQPPHRALFSSWLLSSQASLYRSA
jgi:putative glutamine amidotransferase